MRLMFVAFVAHKNGVVVSGCSIVKCGPIRTIDDFNAVWKTIEKIENYDEGTTVITNFRRLED